VRIRIPSEKVCKKFHLTYELKGTQKGVDILTEYYRVRKMKIVLNGRTVMKGCQADYFENTACFTKKGLKKQLVLHELYHHLVENKRIDMPKSREESLANHFARDIMKIKP
jgi:hypothetical protein